MLTVIYSKDKESEAKGYAAVSKRKSKEKAQATPVRLVSLEQLKVWNITVSSLHVSLAEVHVGCIMRQRDPMTGFSELILQWPSLYSALLNDMHFLKAVLKEYPAVAEIGWQLTDSELLTSLGIALQSINLIPLESTFRNGTLTDVILAISDERLAVKLHALTLMKPDLNG